MTNTNQIDEIKLQFTTLVVKLIPEDAWPLVKTTLITHFIDSMPSQIFVELTGDPLGFEKAEKLLTDYYNIDATNEQLITDAFTILGEDYVLTLLENLDLENVKQL
jgi:hypothetical protein